MGGLTNLQQLEAKHNEISLLPPEMGFMVKCAKMDLSHNMVRTLYIFEFCLQTVVFEFFFCYAQITRSQNFLWSIPIFVDGK